MTLDKNRTYAPKEALSLDGQVAVTLGRGRMSLAADTRCRELAAQGYRIKGYEAVASVGPVKAEPKVVKAAPGNEKVIEEFTILYPREVYKAITPEGKEYGMAEVCNTCHVSLVQNMCEHPTILGEIPVKIVPR